MVEPAAAYLGEEPLGLQVLDLREHLLQEELDRFRHGGVAAGGGRAGRRLTWRSGGGGGGGGGGDLAGKNDPPHGPLGATWAMTSLFGDVSGRGGVHAWIDAAPGASLP